MAMRLPETCDWLRAALCDQVRLVAEVKQAARCAGIGTNTLKNARALCRVESFRHRNIGPYYMSLPGVPHGDEMTPAGQLGPIGKSDNAIAGELAMSWRDSHGGGVGGGSAAPGLYAQVEWVAERLLIPMREILAEEIPCCSALSLLLWAKNNENDFRQMYDAKRMERVLSVKSKAPKGFKDVGGGGQAMIDRLLKRTGT